MPAWRAEIGEPSSACVCIPARNEARRLPALIASLAAQTVAKARPLSVVVVVNNSDDGSETALQKLARVHAKALDVHADIIDFAPDLRHAGSARRRAMALGARILQDAGHGDGALISTDADALPPPNWVEANLAALAAGADLVGGRLEVDADETRGWPPTLRATHAHIAEYWSAVRALEDLLDPTPWDPAPRHGDHTGASLGLRVALHDAVGGVPALPHAEDIAFVRAAQALGARLRHPPDVWVRVSPREDGRAAGGMAQAMRATREAVEREGAVRMPAAAAWIDRIAWRKAVRAEGGPASVAKLEPELPPLASDTPIEEAAASLVAAAREVPTAPRAA
ncbi:MAG TPA: glycosyltransferase [Hansschlegelia sp.]